MSDLYAVAHLCTEPALSVPFDGFQASDYYEFVLLAGGDGREEEGIAGLREKLVALFSEAPLDSHPSLVKALIPFLPEDVDTPDLVARLRAGESGWGTSLVKDEKTSFYQRYQWLAASVLHDAWPKTYPQPEAYRVTLFVTSIHPDAGMLDNDSPRYQKTSMAARLLIDGDQHHPYRAFTGKPWEQNDFTDDLLLAVSIHNRRQLPVEELTKKVGLSKEEACAGDFYEADWEIYLPQRWIGKLVGSWESTAFADY